ncbi:unnamed protein product [Miscanthus lutarioriparius]|uniref:F-box domain-containing protein n=1 Tax=Miscanthus lutarioriparius TaxID=422564 RepID=A0A811RAC4_9POAL|nr:unnamed protein product [Miscanthus lutarioriparius]
MCSPPPPPDAGDPASQPIFTEEILGEIFLRLDTAADLARASAACTAFLRVVRFLRRNRSLYRQPVIGFLECAGRTPSSTLSPSTMPSRRTAPPPPLAASRRPLISPAPLSPTPAPGCSTTPPVAACSCARIPPTIRPTSRTSWCATPYSAATSQWRRVTFDGWKMNGYITFVLTSCCYHPHISVYKTSRLFSEVLMLDTHKMEFSVVRTPVLRFRQHAIIEAGEGRLGFLTIGDGMLDLYCKAWQDNGVSAEEWQHEKTIPIPLPDSDRYSISFCGTGDGYLLIQAIPPDSAELEHMPEIHYFTLHLKTLMVERLCMLNKRVYFAHLYANFLPPLSLPSV